MAYELISTQTEWGFIQGDTAMAGISVILFSFQIFLAECISILQNAIMRLCYFSSHLCRGKARQWP